MNWILKVNLALFLAQNCLAGDSMAVARSCVFRVTNVTANLIAWWKLDENSGTTAADASGNNKTSYLTNSPTWTNGVMGGGLHFVAASNQFAGATNVVQLGIDFIGTVHFWARGSGTAVGNTRTTSEYYGSGWIIVNTNGSLTYRIGCRSISPWNYPANSTRTANIASWNHYVAVVDMVNDTVVFYINGLAETTNTGRIINMSSGNYTLVNIGKMYDYSWGNYFNGDIDDVRIYNRLLSAAEVNHLYNWRP